MKKIILISSLLILNSCNDKTPKCDDKEVIETVKSIILNSFENKLKIKMGVSEEEFRQSEFDRTKNMTAIELEVEDKRKEEKEKIILATSISNIITNEIDKELKSCGCEGTFKNSNDNIYGVSFGVTIRDGDKINYNVKTDSEGEILVEVMSF